MIQLIPFLLQSAVAGEPDLRFVDIDAYYTQTNDTFNLLVKVENVGDAAAGGFWVDAFASSDWSVCDDQEWSSKVQNGLAAGATQWFTFQFDAALVALDDIHIYVDLDNNVDESNEKNNDGVVFALPENTNEDRIGIFQSWYDNPDCLVDFVDDFGWLMQSSADMLYAKARVL